MRKKQGPKGKAAARRVPKTQSRARARTPRLGASWLKKALPPIQKECPRLQALYVFGSQAQGTATPASDFDLAFLSSAPMEAQRRFDLQETLARLLGKDVDLVDLRAANTVLRAQIISTGERLFTARAAKTEVERFEMLAYSLYAQLNEDRRGILEDIEKRGSIRGK